MNFDQAYEAFLGDYAGRRKGERRRRLLEGHAHAEKCFLQEVWWPVFKSFDHLHPEYEIADFKDGVRYLDFAFIRGQLRLALEIDGYGPHWRNISRAQFSDHLMRQNHLLMDGWKLLRFSYDDLTERPLYCQQLVQQFMGIWMNGMPHSGEGLSAEQREIIRFASGIARPIEPNDVCRLLGVQKAKARKLLHSLVELEWLAPDGGGTVRIRRYRLNRVREFA